MRTHHPGDGTTAVNGDRTQRPHPPSVWRTQDMQRAAVMRRRDGLIMADVCGSREDCGPCPVYPKHGRVTYDCTCCDENGKPYP